MNGKSNDLKSPSICSEIMTIGSHFFYFKKKELWYHRFSVPCNDYCHHKRIICIMWLPYLSILGNLSAFLKLIISSVNE